MARTKRICPAGEVFHVLNRAVARLTIFEKPEDYAAFMRVVQETWEIVPLPIYAMVAMPNHWHFVVRPETTDQVSEFFRRLTVMHTMRWHAHYKTGGTGHLGQKKGSGLFVCVASGIFGRLGRWHVRNAFVRQVKSFTF
jgi:putative transposase